MYILSLMFEEPDKSRETISGFVCVTEEGTLENERLKDILKNNVDEKRRQKLDKFLEDTEYKDEDIMFYDFDVKDMCDIRRRLEYLLEIKITSIWQTKKTMSIEDAREMFKELQKRIIAEDWKKLKEREQEETK